MSRPLRVYLETTTWRFATDPRVSEESRQLTRLFFRELVARQHDPWISDFVLEEIQATEPAATRDTLLAGLKRMRPGLIVTDDRVGELANLYVATGVFPQEALRGVAHLAAAVVNEMDVLATWDEDFLGKQAARRRVDGVNLLAGYRLLEILTPRDFVSAPAGPEKKE